MGKHFDPDHTMAIQITIPAMAATFALSPDGRLWSYPWDRLEGTDFDTAFEVEPKAFAHYQGMFYASLQRVLVMLEEQTAEHVARTLHDIAGAGAIMVSAYGFDSESPSMASLNEAAVEAIAAVLPDPSQIEGRTFQFSKN